MSRIEIKYRVKEMPLPEGVEKRDVVKSMAKFLLNRVRFHTPVKTGKLKRGWRMKFTRNTITLTNRVRYASYIDSGITPARDPSKGQMHQRSLKDASKKILSKYNIPLGSFFTIQRS